MSDMTTLSVDIAKVIQRQDETNRRLERIERELDTKYTRGDETEDIVRRVGVLEDVLKWITRTVIGFIVLAVLGTVIAVKKGIL